MCHVSEIRNTLFLIIGIMLAVPIFGILGAEDLERAEYSLYELVIGFVLTPIYFKIAFGRFKHPSGASFFTTIYSCDQALTILYIIFGIFCAFVFYFRILK